MIIYYDVWYCLKRKREHKMNKQKSEIRDNNEPPKSAAEAVKEVLIDGMHSIPNLMSVFRILLIPAIVILYFKGHGTASVVLVILSALTDLFDGIIARRFNQITELGKALDPIADKLTLGTIMICLAIKNDLFLAIVLVMVVKESIGFATHWILFRHCGEMYGAEWYGKVSTWILYITAALVMLFADLPDFVLYGCIALCVLSIVLAAFMYSVRGLKILRKGKKSE